MAIKNFKPTTNARRKMSTLVNEEITKTTPEKSLTVIMKKNGGRNDQGKITVRHHGGGEGRAPVGRKGPVTPWGKPALGYKTRKKKASDKFIVRRRNAK